MPGMTVLTAGCWRMCRSASSGIDMPAGTTGRSLVDALERLAQVVGLEVDVAEVPVRPRRVRASACPVRLPSSNGTRAITAMLRRWHSDEQLVLGRLVEDVVDDLDAVDQIGGRAPSTRSPAASG